MARREVRQVFGTPAAQPVGTHAKLEQAYVRDRERFLLVLYCPDCLHGFVSDLVRELPAGTPHVRDAGITVARSSLDQVCRADTAE